MVLLLDSKQRQYLVTLQLGKEFHSHAGYISHEEIIGAGEGVTLRSTRGASYTVLRPTLSEFILKMPRGAQVIYPKDLGTILMLADIFPGARVLESGVGSGMASPCPLHPRSARRCDRNSARRFCRLARQSEACWQDGQCRTYREGTGK
mgnify:CR=1 FL=1